MALMLFKIDGGFDAICSDPMLGINSHRIESNSVGYKSDYAMYSLDFEEFLWAKGYDDTLLKICCDICESLYRSTKWRWRSVVCFSLTTASQV